MAGSINPQYIQGYATSITGIINSTLVPTLLAVAFLVFLWGIYKYFIKGAADPKAQESGKTFALYGIIGFVIIFAVWGIVGIFMDTLNLSSNASPTPPTVSGSSATNSNPFISGCMDPAATNYNKNANVHNDSSCVYPHSGNQDMGGSLLRLSP